MTTAPLPQDDLLTAQMNAHEEGVRTMASRLREILDGRPCIASEPPELAEVAARLAPAQAETAEPSDGWRWMSHPSRNEGKPIPVYVWTDGDGTWYRPFNERATEFDWNERDEDWKLASPSEAMRRDASRWWPIETAPKDGTHILAYWPRHPFDEEEEMDESIDLGGIQAVTWRNGSGWIEPDYLDASGSWFGDDFCYATVPTFWKPLDAAPTSLPSAQSEGQS